MKTLTLLFTLSALALAHAGEPAFTPKPPRIETPRSTGGPTLSVTDFGARPDDEADDYVAFRAALRACRKTGASVLQVPPGVYWFRSAAATESRAHLRFEHLSDLSVEAAGAEFRFTRPVTGIHVLHCTRLSFSGFKVTWDLPLASVGTVGQSTEGEWQIELEPAFAADPMPPAVAVSPFDIPTHGWITTPVAELHAGYRGTARMLPPRTYFNPEFRRFPAGTTVVVRHFDLDGTGMLITHDSSDITCRKLVFSQIPGMAWVAHTRVRGLHLDRCELRRRADSPDVISATRDGLHTIGVSDILVEGCDFSGMGDDSVNIASPYRLITSVDAGGRFKTAAALKSGELVGIRSRIDLTLRGLAPVSGSEDGGYWLEQRLESALEAGDFVEQRATAVSRVILRDNRFHDHRGVGIIFKGEHALIERNEIANLKGPGILIHYSRQWPEGFASGNVVISGNRLRNVNGGKTHQPALSRGAITVVAEGENNQPTAVPVHRDLVLQGNVIEGSPNPAIAVASADSVWIRGNQITPGAGEQDAKPILVEKASNVEVSH